MTKLLFLILGLSFAVPALPQGYEEMNASEFLNSSIPDAEFDLFKPDYSLLNATLLHTINYKRLKKGYTQLKMSPELIRSADSFCRANRTSRFVFNDQNVQRLNKSIKPLAKWGGFKGNLVGFAISAPYALNYKPGRDFYFNRKDSESQYKLYYGNIRDKNNPKVPKKLIPAYTYRQFADALVRQWLRGTNGRAIMNKGYNFFGCAVQVDPATLLKYRIPVAKSIAILGGQYINFDR